MTFDNKKTSSYLFLQTIKNPKIANEMKNLSWLIFIASLTSAMVVSNGAKALFIRKSHKNWNTKYRSIIKLFAQNCHYDFNGCRFNWALQYKSHKHSNRNIVFARHQPLCWYTIFPAVPHRLNSTKRNHHKNGVAMFAQTKQPIYILSAIN